MRAEIPIRFYPIGNVGMKHLLKYGKYNFYDAGKSNSFKRKSILIITLSPSEQLNCIYFLTSSRPSKRKAIAEAKKWIRKYEKTKQRYLAV